MKTTTSLVAEDVRLKQWALDIKDCQNRPADMTVGDWCEMHGLKKVTYYYRLKRVREACLSMAGMESVPTFVEMEAPQESIQEEANNSLLSKNISAILTLPGGGKVEIMESASSTFLRNLFEAYHHAQ